MSKAARMNVVDMKMEKYEMPTEIMVNLKKFKDLDGYDVGHKCSGTFSGVVRSISKSKDGESRMTIEVSSLKKGEKYAEEEKENQED